MPTFTTYDGSELTATVLGAPAEPVVVLPGGPLQTSRYLGNLGGLDAHRELVVLELRHRRVDQLVGDVEALREHLGRERIDLIGHSAGRTLALLYAAAHPNRIGKLALITPSARAVDIPPTPDEMHAVYAQRAGQPWLRRGPGSDGRLGRRHRNPAATPAGQGARVRPLGRRRPGPRGG
jgi:pimeloyl-ACP methyl ester carboxylesterase